MIISTLDIQPAMQSILVVWLAIAVERIVPISGSIDPLKFFRFVCERMALKVLKTNYRGKQAYISGSLGLVVLILPIVVIAYLVREFASYQWLLDILLLWVLLQYNGHVKNISQSMLALSQDKKQLAKNLLQQSVLRKTNKLSTLGLVKSGLESLFLRYNHQYITVIFWFLLAGPIAALAYRLCYEANQIWSPKLPAYIAFGASSKVITQFFQFIPSLLSSLSFMLMQHPSDAISCIVSKQYWINALTMQRLILLQSLANGLQITISGPVIYGDDKVRYPRLYSTSRQSVNRQSQSQEATLDHVKILLSQTNKHLMVSLILVTWIVFWVNH